MQFLVTGATGRHGSTGLFVARKLREKGFDVRAQVRVLDERVKPLETIGCEIVQADYTDFNQQKRALENIEAAYFCYPVTEGIYEATAKFAEAARQSEVKRIVNLSMGMARIDSPSRLGQNQWFSERMFDWSGISTIHLRIFALFYENLLQLHGESIRSENRICNNFGDAKLNWIGGEDVGDLAAELLLNPQKAIDPILSPSGTEQYSHIELADILSRILKKEITYQAVDEREWQAQLAQLPQVSESQAKHISTIGKLASDGYSMMPLNTVAVEILERPLERSEDFVRKHLSAFEA